MGVIVDRILRRYWEQVPEETREAIEAAIPPGHHIRIFAGHRAQPGTGTVALRRDDNSEVASTRGRDLAAMARWVTGAGTVRITTTADGYITDIEDIP